MASPRQAQSDAILLKSMSRLFSAGTQKSFPRLLNDPPGYSLPDPLFSPFTSQLDPFFPLPCKVTHRDKSLVHCYLTEMRGPVYGIHGKVKGFCPIRDKTAINVQSNQTYLQWIVLMAEMFLLQGRPAPADEPHILGRKAYIYKLMNKAIANPTTCYLDNTLAVVATAGCAEAYSGDLALGRRHLLALKTLIEGRGGSTILQDMLFGQAILIVVGRVTVGLGEANFSDTARLKRDMGSFISTFQAMQSWNQRLREEFGEFRDGAMSSSRMKMSTDTFPSLSHTFHGTNARDIQRYSLSRRKVFGETAVLRKYMEPQSTSIEIRNRRYHFAVLWIINKLLYDLKTDLDKSKEFLEGILLNVSSSEFPGQDSSSNSSAEARLTPLTMFCIAAACAAEHNPEFAERGGILHSWDAVDMLELMELASKDSQEEVTALLSSWLTNDECDIFYIGERRIEEISREIEEEWLRRQRQHQQ